MTTEQVTPAAVREAILAYLADEESQAVEASWGLFHALAKTLNVDLSAGTLRERAIAEDKFTAKVRRALAKLAEDKVLVKVPGFRPALYLTPKEHTRREQQRISAEAAQRAADERALALRNRIRALGISGTNYTDNYGRITMDLGMVEALLTLAERQKS